MRGLFTIGNLCSPAGVQMALAVPAGHALVLMAVVGEAHWSQRRHLMTSREDRHELVSEEGEEDAWGTHAFL